MMITINGRLFSIDKLRPDTDALVEGKENAIAERLHLQRSLVNVGLGALSISHFTAKEKCIEFEKVASRQAIDGNVNGDAEKISAEKNDFHDTPWCFSTKNQSLRLDKEMYTHSASISQELYSNS